jgi:hypothetical protein
MRYTYIVLVFDTSILYLYNYKEVIMMYSDIALQVAIKFNELPAEKQILIMQSILIIAEVIAFFYIRHITKTN